MAGTWQPRGGNALRVGLLTIIASVAATLVVRALSRVMLDISPESPPLAIAGPTVFFTVVFVPLGVLVFTTVRRFASHPTRLFRIIAVGALLLSRMPDLLLLTEGASAAFPGANGAAVGVLMCQHVVAAAVVVWMLTIRGAVGGQSLAGTCVTPPRPTAPTDAADQAPPLSRATR